MYRLAAWIVAEQDWLDGGHEKHVSHLVIASRDAGETPPVTTP